MIHIGQKIQFIPSVSINEQYASNAPKPKAVVGTLIFVNCKLQCMDIPDVKTCADCVYVNSDPFGVDKHEK